MKINIPGRVLDFSHDGEAYIDYYNFLNKGQEPVETPNLGADEIELWDAVKAGKRINPSKGGYYVKADLSPAALSALHYWAETLFSASGDDARWGEPDAILDHRAAGKCLEKLSALGVRG